jgi:hypothetical protein
LYALPLYNDFVQLSKSGTTKKSETNMTTPEVTKENIYQSKVEDLSGKVLTFALKGKKS